MERNCRKKPRTDSWPDDIISDILVRSPVKSLLRFKCLSKQWYSLIENPTFISGHLRHSNLKPHSAICTVRQYHDTHQFGVSFFHADEYFIDDSMPLLPECFLHYNLKLLRVKGSLHSLVLIAAFASTNGRNTFILWNPATRQSRLLPLPMWHGSGMASYGFGFVSETNDYKLFRFVIFDIDYFLLEENDVHYNIGFSNKAQIFSFRTGCWKQIENVAECFSNDNGNSVAVNGVWYHFMDFENRNVGQKKSFILSFDMKDEVFHRIELPDEFQQEKQRGRLLEYRESLAVVGTGKEGHHILIMENGFWSKLITIGVLNGLKSAIGVSGNSKLILRKRGYYDDHMNGDHENGMWLYDLANQSLKEFHAERVRTFCGAENYVESLVSVNEPFHR